MKKLFIFLLNFKYRMKILIFIQHSKFNKMAEKKRIANPKPKLSKIKKNEHRIGNVRKQYI